MPSPRLAAVVDKDAEIAELKARLEEERQARQDNVSEAQDAARLADENLRLRRNQLEMEKFLADYGASPLAPCPCVRMHTGCATNDRHANAAACRGGRACLGR